MATNIEYLNKTTPKQNEEHHTSWLGAIIERIQDIDIDFPLSGGEGNEQIVFSHSSSNVPEGAATEYEAENIKPAEYTTSWLSSIIDKVQDLECAFPLSGGEHYHN